MNVYIYIYYNDRLDTDLDKRIEAFVAQELQGERVASGFGLGLRDLEFKIEAPLDQARLDIFADSLRADTAEKYLSVSQDAWTEDEEDPEEIEEHNLLAA